VRHEDACGQERWAGVANTGERAGGRAERLRQDAVLPLLLARARRYGALQGDAHNAGLRCAGDFSAITARAATARTCRAMPRFAAACDFFLPLNTTPGLRWALARYLPASSLRNRAVFTLQYVLERKAVGVRAGAGVAAGANISCRPL